ncbi:hypothetical protein KZ813_10240 [Sphingomonas sp. RHCKR7]|nr:hypothetical protein [Sphingomonas folli]
MTGKRPPTDGADPSPGSNVPPSTGQTFPDDPPKKPGGATVSKVKTMVEYPNKEQADAVKELRDRVNAIDKSLKNIKDEKVFKVKISDGT